MTPKRFSFGREEKLKSRKAIMETIHDGFSFNSHPFRFTWKATASEGAALVRVVVSIPKRNFPLATVRNRIRRKIREAYRLNKHFLYLILEENFLKIDLLVIYTGKEIYLYEELEKKLLAAFQRFKNEYEKNNKNS